MNDGTIKTLVAIVALVVLESVALFNGIDGTLFALVLAAISGLGGYSIRPVVEKKLKKVKK